MDLEDLLRKSLEQAKMKLSVASSAPLSPALPDVPTAAEVASYMRVDVKTVYAYARRGKLPCKRLGTRVIFHGPTLLKWLAGS